MTWGQHPVVPRPKPLSPPQNERPATTPTPAPRSSAPVVPPHLPIGLRIQPWVSGRLDSWTQHF